MSPRFSTNYRSNTLMTDSLGKVKTALTPQERFEEFLQMRGMRNTNQRRSLLEFVFRKHEHFDVDQLIEQLPSKGKPGYVSRPTVYRTLSEFVDAGLLRKIEVGGRTVYEHDYGYPQHDHLYCNKCQRLFEFDNEEVAEICNAVARDSGFRVTSHRLIISGVCRRCREKRMRKRRQVDMV